MKTIVLLLTLGCGAVAVAQTNGPLTLPTNAPATKPQPPTEIISDAADFDMNAHQAIYRGHVKVTDPEVKLTCDWLVVDLPAAGAHLSHVLADTNVVVDFTDEKGEKYHVTSARAVYAYKVVNAVTNETVTFTGRPKVVTATSTIKSEPMIWDRARNKFTFINPIMTMVSTNAPAGGTNASPFNFLK